MKGFKSGDILVVKTDVRWDALDHGFVMTYRGQKLLIIDVIVTRQSGYRWLKMICLSRGQLISGEGNMNDFERWFDREET